jgi:hypothetical protein
MAPLQGTLPTEDTTFTRDVQGRYTCNTFQEAINSTDPSLCSGARPFDIVIVGGGTFGSALAQEIFFSDTARTHRIVVLEAGRFLLPEHVKNMPAIGLDAGPAVKRTAGQPQPTQREVWGLAWHSMVPFPGLAYCVGGRSLFWGGWSPQFLDSEMQVPPWPETVVDDLNNRYFAEAAEQIGVDVTNDFIFGALHEALREQLLDGIKAGAVTDAVPLNQLPLRLVVPDGTTDAEKERLKLEAPLAVMSRTKAPGEFPINKFSAVPLLMAAARTAQIESGGDDCIKRLMVVPDCHVSRLIVTNGAVAQVKTSRGDLNLPANGKVIIALGTVESIRLALLSFAGTPNYDLIGKGLMAHLRRNLNIRIPRGALVHLDPTTTALDTSALFVKGRHSHGDGSFGHFHLQITATGLGKTGTNAEAELFRKVPDLDTVEDLRNASDTHVVVAIRGIGEMEPNNPFSRVDLHSETDEFNVNRAVVSINKSGKDDTLLTVMGQAASDVAQIFAGGPLSEPPLTDNIDGLGTTHHEAGGLVMGTNPATSVTNTDGRFHHISNAYALGPCLLPTVGSPNPMLTGIALARRMADHLTSKPRVVIVEPGFEPIFDGTTLTNWRMSTIINQPGHDDPGRFVIVDGALQSLPGTDLGLLWYSLPMPPDFVLRLQWNRALQGDNSGVFVRFPHPNSKNYNNTAYVAIDFGFEVQIDELGVPDGLAIHRTGAIYNEPSQTLTQQAALPAGQWNDYEIRVQGQTYTILLNGSQVTVFNNPHAGRGLPSTPTAPSFIGLQTHTGRVSFRDIRVMPL